MQLSILFMLTLVLLPIYTYFSAAVPRSGGEYIYVSRVTPVPGFHRIVDIDNRWPQLAG
jgi:amino acid transporter